METNYHELIDLTHIPEVNLELAASLAEWEKKDKFAAHHFEFENRWTHYFQKLFIPQMHHFKDEKPFIFRWFELIKVNHQWEIKLIFPFMKFKLFHENILPEDIIDRITDTLVNPNEVVTMKRVHSKLLDIAMDLQIVHLSSTYIFGTVKYSSKIKSPVKVNEAELLKVILSIKDIFPKQFDQFIKKYLTLVPPISLSCHKQRSVYDLVKMPLKNKQNPLNEFKNFPLNQGEEINTCGMHRLLKMMMIPEVNERLMLKWHEIQEGYHKKAIEAYKINKERLYKYMFTDRNLKRNALKGSPPLYWFEMTAAIPTYWVVTKLEPKPPMYEPAEDIIPEEFMNVVSSAKPDGNMIKCIYEFKQPSWRELDIWWIRYSPNCVMGSVCEYTEDLDQLQASYDALLKGNLDIKPGHLYRLFVYHLRSQRK